MNPLVTGGIAIALFAALTGGAYYQGRQDGWNAKVAESKTTEDLLAAASDMFDAKVGDRIGGIKVVHQTIQGKLIRETSTNTVYRDCEHTPAGLQQLNQALTNGARPVSSSASGVP